MNQKELTKTFMMISRLCWFNVSLTSQTLSQHEFDVLDEYKIVKGIDRSRTVYFGHCSRYVIFSLTAASDVSRSFVTIP